MVTVLFQICKGDTSINFFLSLWRFKAFQKIHMFRANRNQDMEIKSL